LLGRSRRSRTSATRGFPEARITTLTLATLLVCFLGVLNTRGYGLALALGGATPIGAAALVGGIAVPTFYAVALGAAAGVALRVLQRTRWTPGALPESVPGARPLILLTVVAVLVTFIAPMLFDGLEVYSPGGRSRLAAGILTKSNLAQITYLILSVCVVLFLARSRWAGVGIVGLAAISTTLLSLWAWSATHGVPYPMGVFDNSPAFAIQDRLPNGLPRVRGILSEPAGLAGSSLITIAYSLSRMGSVGVVRRVGLLVAVGAAVFLGSISTSATFFVAGAVLAVLAVSSAVFRFLLRGAALGRGAAAMVCAVAIGALWVLPWVASLLEAVVDEKLGSSSYDDRSGADSYALELVVRTFGLGTGLGSNRASSFVATLLSTVGVVGTLLFVVAVWVLVRDSSSVREVRPATWALAGLLTTKVISGPDLADTNGILWMALGVLAHAAMRQRHRWGDVGARVVRPTRPAPARSTSSRASFERGRPGG
jgi:hypothetical protein